MAGQCYCFHDQTLDRVYVRGSYIKLIGSKPSNIVYGASIGDLQKWVQGQSQKALGSNAGSRTCLWLPSRPQLLCVQFLHMTEVKDHIRSHKNHYIFVFNKDAATGSGSPKLPIGETW